MVMYVCMYVCMYMFQGRKFIDRFDAVSYVKITEQMDTHDVGRARGGVKSALATISSRLGFLPSFFATQLQSIICMFISMYVCMYVCMYV